MVVWQRLMVGLIVLVVAIVLMAIGGAWYGPTSAEVRLDCGDLRYRYWGIPVVYVRTLEPARSRLMALAGKSGVWRFRIPTGWRGSEEAVEYLGLPP